MTAQVALAIDLRAVVKAGLFKNRQGIPFRANAQRGTECTTFKDHSQTLAAYPFDDPARPHLLTVSADVLRGLFLFSGDFRKPVQLPAKCGQFNKVVIA